MGITEILFVSDNYHDREEMIASSRRLLDMAHVKYNVQVQSPTPAHMHITVLQLSLPVGWLSSLSHSDIVRYYSDLCQCDVEFLFFTHRQYVPPKPIVTINFSSIDDSLCNKGCKTSSWFVTVCEERSPSTDKQWPILTLTSHHTHDTHTHTHTHTHHYTVFVAGLINYSMFCFVVILNFPKHLWYEC